MPTSMTSSGHRRSRILSLLAVQSRSARGGHRGNDPIHDTHHPGQLRQSHCLCGQSVSVQAIAYLQRVAVEPRWQGHGMGRSLVRVVARKARASGAKVLLLNTQTDNDSAIRLYEDEGFIRLPEPLSLLHAPPDPMTNPGGK